MQTSDIYHTQGIRGFKVLSTHYEKDSCIVRIKAKEHLCPRCDSSKVNAYPVRERSIQGQKCGSKRFFIKVDVHRIYCTACRSSSYERLPFLPHPKARITRSLARSILELRSSMSLSTISRHYGLDWDTVKALEIRELEKKYKRIRLKDLRIMGIDEIHVGHEWSAGRRRHKYLSIVRDMISGAVLFVGDGKGCDALAPFKRRIAQFRANIEAVCMDMSNAYAKWATEEFPNARVVYDHFHLIKLANEKLDMIRRKVQNELDGQNREELKGKRWHLLRNREDLDEEDTLFMARLRHISKELHDAWLLKEQLRSIYRVADNAATARSLLTKWAGICQRMQSKPMATLGRTVQRHMDGICAYWLHDRLTNAATEGFNNKVRHMIAQGYGYSDYKYVKLKIYALPSMRLRTELINSCS